MVTRALERIGLTSAVGEIPGEYCPGEFSINHAGTVKLAGLGQRLARHAAHIGGVLVVGNTEAIRDVLVPTYSELAIEWNPATVGSINDIIPGVDASDVINAIVKAIEEDREIVPISIDPVTLARARELAPLHVP